MKLIVQIPCLDEEKTIASAVKDIPRQIAGIDKVEILVIDDGSSDQTSPIAKEAGAEHIIRFSKTKGLGPAFSAGIETALKLGADIIVNTDGDNQYRGEDIPKLVQPILDGKAEIVIGDRKIASIKEFSFLKKLLHRLGNAVVRRISGLVIFDATSGFRAISQDAALRLNLKTKFSHTIETIIFAAKGGIPLMSIPVKTNPQARPSRLAPNMWNFIKQSIASIIRIYLIYEPFKTFLTMGAILFFAGFALGVRFLYFFFTAQSSGHTQSLILAAILIILGFLLGVIGLLADLIAANRKLTEEQLLRIKRVELNLSDKNKDGQN